MHRVDTEVDLMLSGDRLLAVRAKRGDTEAFERLVLRYQDLAFRAAFLITSDAGDAEDALQEGMVKAYYGLDRFRPGAAFKPWLLQIITNEARNRERTRRTPAIPTLDICSENG